MMQSETSTPSPLSLKGRARCVWVLLLFLPGGCIGRSKGAQDALKAQRKLYVLYVALGSLINGATPAE